MASLSLMEHIVSSAQDQRVDVVPQRYILLAEHNAAVREVTAKALEVTGLYRVVDVPNVAEALEQMAHCSFVAILLDPRVEGIEDLEATRELYLSADKAGCPVIAFSDIPQSDLGLAYPFGFAGVVTKPFWALSLGDQVTDIRARYVLGNAAGGRD